MFITISLTGQPKSKLLWLGIPFLQYTECWFFLLGAKVTLIGRMDAAFYVTHYIKWFDGDKLTFTINGEELSFTIGGEELTTFYEPPLPDYTNYVFHDCSVKRAMGG